jgi:hypothetical protein
VNAKVGLHVDERNQAPDLTKIDLNLMDLHSRPKKREREKTLLYK